MKKTRLIIVLALTFCLILSVSIAEETADQTGTFAAQIDLSAIVQAVFALLAALITYKLIPWIRSKTTEQQQRVLDAVISTAVYAAEQLYGAGNGEKKLSYAMQFLKSKGYNVDSQTVKNGVEAAVKALSIQAGISDSLTAIPAETAKTED